MGFEAESINMIFGPKKSWRILTVKGLPGNEISFCPGRGGIITSLKLNGREILYFNDETFRDINKNVRGGIPILFPNVGELKNSPYPLKQHGLARTSKNWRVKLKNIGGFTEILAADKETKKIFPWNFSLAMKGQWESDGSISLIQEITNWEKDSDMPLAMGLHPYFKVPKDRKQDIKFDFPGGEIIAREYANWSQGGTTIIDNPKLKDPAAILRVIIPGIGAVIMDISAAYQKIWIWSLPGWDFICLEPSLRDLNGLIDNPELIKSRQSFRAKINYRLE